MIPWQVTSFMALIRASMKWHEELTFMTPMWSSYLRVTDVGLQTRRTLRWPWHHRVLHRLVR